MTSSSFSVVPLHGPSPLQVPGVGSRAGSLYRTLLKRTRWTVPEMRATLPWSGPVLESALGELDGVRLITPSADRAGAVRAVEPALALGRRPDPRHVATAHRPACRGVDGATSLVERLVGVAETQVTVLAPTYRPHSFAFATHIADGALRRGAELRTVLPADLLRSATVIAHTEWLGRNATRARAVPSLPVAAVVVDGRSAVVVDADGTGRLVDTQRETEELVAIAHRMWRSGADVVGCGPAVGGEGGSSGRGRREQVLALLADGLTDDAIARQIGVSVRTVRTEVAAALEHLGARSRFQAGVRAAQIGMV
jgi:DNA-binding CsgD family transcriptional regulator